MKHLLLKFNYGVEIGAMLAYMGHYEATHDAKILGIANDEYEHQEIIKFILKGYGTKPFFLFNWFFYAVGNLIRLACRVSPRFLMNFIARSMEIFAVFNYRRLAKMYPEHRHILEDMAA
ncbi:MAG TPA: hypothetical protein VMT62_15210, partial [Syntrophorhabdaceae bacterium]|nr:hypothetical protein [Syntrophorhabdaceae bacterium]